MRTAPRFSLVRILLGLAFAIVLALAVRDGRAQPSGRLDGLQAQGSAYLYAKPGEPTVRVAVTGDVRSPGLYEINATIDLATLVAFAGGPVSQPEQDLLEQRTTVRLLRGAERSVVYDGQWPDVQGVASVALADGDQVQVRLYTRRIRTWRDDAQLVSLGASVATVLLQIVNLLR